MIGPKFSQLLVVFSSLINNKIIGCYAETASQYQTRRVCRDAKQPPQQLHNKLSGYPVDWFKGLSIKSRQTLFPKK